MPSSTDRSEDWEARLGRQVRDLRLRVNRSQVDLAAAANIATSTLQSLERGEGSSVRTLIQVARALGREDWLTSLAPEVTVSPMQLLRERQAAESRSRRRASGGERRGRA